MLMSEQEIINMRAKLDRGLRDSYEKMLRLKMKLGEAVVVTDADGFPVTIPAEEAWLAYSINKD